MVDRSGEDLVTVSFLARTSNTSFNVQTIPLTCIPFDSRGYPPRIAVRFPGSVIQPPLPTALSTEMFKFLEVFSLHTVTWKVCLRTTSPLSSISPACHSLYPSTALCFDPLAAANSLLHAHHQVSVAPCGSGSPWRFRNSDFVPRPGKSCCIQSPRSSSTHLLCDLFQRVRP